MSDLERSVRVEAARILGSDATLSEEEPKLAPAWSEFLAAVSANADRAEWHSLYATALAARGDTDFAIQELKSAIALNPRLGGAYVNLADIYRQVGREDLCEKTLAEGLAMDSQNAALHAAMGLTHVRLGRAADALPELAQAESLDPDNGAYSYLYAAALRTRNAGEAVRYLEAALADPRRRHERSEFLLLMQLLIEARDTTGIGPYLSELRARAASDPRAQSLLMQIESQSYTATPTPAGGRAHRDR